MAFSGTKVQHMEHCHQALAPDLSKTGRDYQPQGEGLCRHMEKTVQTRATDSLNPIYIYIYIYISYT